MRQRVPSIAVWAEHRLPLVWLARIFLATAFVVGLAAWTKAHQDVRDATQVQEAANESDSATADRQALNLAALEPARNPVRLLAQRYRLDRELLERYYNIELSPTRHERLRQFHQEWLEATAHLPTDHGDEEARRSYRRLREQIYRNLADIEAASARWLDVSPLLPFAQSIIALAETRQVVNPIDPTAIADTVQQIATSAQLTREAVQDAVANHSGSVTWTKELLEQAAQDCDTLRKLLRAWFEFYNAYDPSFTWWVRQPFADADKQLEAYGKSLTDLAAERPADARRGSAEAMDGASGPAPPLPLANGPEFGQWTTSRETRNEAPNIEELLAVPTNRMEPVLARYAADFARGGRGNSRGRSVSRDSVERWIAAIEEIPFDEYTVQEQVDYLMLRNALQNQHRRMDLPREAGEEVTGPAGIRGRPIGREALLVELQREMIPYSPEELIDIALRELSWCRRELTAAAAELGFGDDWRAAVEHVKTLYVPPGEQPVIVRRLSDEAVEYLRAHDLITIPPLANETWRMRMMPLDQQLITPFFTGGEVVSVGFPTHDMAHDAKLQSLRGNNIPFSRATVHHELIPGHGLQQFMSARYATHRGPFSTPFWTEGWALYWEMLLYDHGFAATPADRIGFMVWRSHRCARIVFSLSFHLGLMTPGECVEYLVDNVGFERMGAEGEVRRSFGGMYPPLYQAAYMVGGLQFRALHREFVQSDRMSPRAFHDFILRQGRIPVAMIRLLLHDEPLHRDRAIDWRFYDQP